MRVTCREAALTDKGQAAQVLRLLDEYSREAQVSPAGSGSQRAQQKAGGRGDPPEDFLTLLEGKLVWSSRLIAEFIKRPYIHAFLAYGERGAEPVGLAVTVESSDSGGSQGAVNVRDVCVASDCRSKGIGRALLAHVAARAKHQGFCKITLEVLEGNAPAKACYVKAGFKKYAVDKSVGCTEFWEKTL